jgi:hypothetical protein
LAEAKLFVNEKSKVQLNQLVYDAVDYQKGKRRYVSPPTGLDMLVNDKSRAILRCLSKNDLEDSGPAAWKKVDELVSASFTSKDLRESTRT